MVDSISHRGPDDEGYYSSKGYSAGMRRLSINGIKDGNQPLYNENKDIIGKLIIFEINLKLKNVIISTVDHLFSS